MADDDLKDLADAGVEVLGPEEWVLEPSYRPGNWLLAGGAIAVASMTFTHIGPWWTLGIAFLAGTAANEWEKQQIKARLKARRDSFDRD